MSVKVLQDWPLRLYFIPILLSKAYYYLDDVFCNWLPLYFITKIVFRASWVIVRLEARQQMLPPTLLWYIILFSFNNCRGLGALVVFLFNIEEITLLIIHCVPFLHLTCYKVHSSNDWYSFSKRAIYFRYLDSEIVYHAWYIIVRSSVDKVSENLIPYLCRR